jgi:HD-GYP domain-containing protein (c-di-GMP phosphodiesterase class II)
MAQKDAKEELIANSGSQFDPDVVRIFLLILGEKEKRAIT